jgi:hypothetical protein
MFSDDFGDDIPEWAVNKPEQVRQFRTREGGYEIPDCWIEGNPNPRVGCSPQPLNRPTAQRRRQPLLWWEWALILAPFALILTSIALGGE